ncbi:peptidase domain-containing ABC transporter [Entomohabitans teleogrylli]|uniref:peptidase domain-containing ABC transporter n=1 Tax=Entomohabitans teleogrylli TaxID=1384589 RepID=UPI00073D4F50|nr:ATP-binding cassette domain-containing protein [Entomohabitans teleogrylli]
MKTIIPDMIFQEETNECGLACIAMLAQTRGVSLSLEALREVFPASDHGTSLNDLSNILQRTGIATTPVLFDHQELGELPFPAILHYGASHYVVLAYRKGNTACVMNPAIGQQWLPFSALKKEISGYALILEDSPAQTAPAPGEIPGQGKKMAGAMSLKETAAVPGIYGLMLMTFLVSLTLFLMPTMVSNAINQAFSSTGNMDFPYFLFIIAFVASTLLALGVRVISERFIRRFVLLHSGIGFSRLLSNPLRFFEKRAPGEVFSRFVAWQGGLTQKIELDNGLRSDWVICAIAIGIMFWIAPVLAAISAVGVTIMGLISIWAVIRDRWYTQQLQLKSASLNDFFMETLQGVLTIKTAGLESQRKTQFAALSHDLFTCMQRQKIYQQIKDGFYQLTGSLEMVIFMLMVLPLVNSKQISLGDFFAYSFLRQIFTSYITRIFFSIIRKSQLHVIDTRAHSLFPQRETVEPMTGSQGGGQQAQRLTFERVSFHYDPVKPVLNQVALDLPPGSQIAIAGESGAGKSTLLRLIAGLFSPQQGRCLLDEREVTSRQLAEQVWLQSQEDILFNASVLQNITLFDPWYSDSDRSRVESLLDSLALGPVVRALPGGMEALIRESHAALSLGQRQRLLLARAMYSTRPILLLDEPTANLDDDTAQIVMATIRRHCRESGKTLIVVTHSERILGHFPQVYRLAEGTLTRLDMGEITAMNLRELTA